MATNCNVTGTLLDREGAAYASRDVAFEYVGQIVGSGNAYVPEIVTTTTDASGEHGLYINHSAKVAGLTMRNIRSHGTGQCAVKLRNMEKFSIDGLSARDRRGRQYTGDCR